jgi:hypothetical protein
MKTECRSGHAMTPENTRTMPNGYVRCKACERIAAERNRQQFKGGTGHRVVHSRVDRSTNA